ncbi:MAG: DUF4129 domain-containing protein [Caldilineaceae bacterium]|nr:DUF4129 domain-containing protein [Caldilineaceae bacterium]
MQQERWNWLEDGILPVLLTLMRTAWLWPWLALLRAWLSPSQPGPVLPLAALILVPLLSFTLTRQLLPPLRDPKQPQNINAIQIGIGGIGLLVMLGMLWSHFYSASIPLWSPGWILALGYDLTDLQLELPIQILALFAGVGLWLRGAMDGREPIHHDQVWRVFLTGVGLLALYLWAMRFGLDTPPVDAAPWLIGFFACGMGALAITNLKTASGWSLLGGRGARLSGNRYWVLSIVITIGALLGLGLLLGWLVAPEEIAWLLNGLRIIVSLIGQLLGWVILGMSYVMFGIFYVIYWLLQPLIRWLQTEREPEPEEEGVGPMMPEEVFDMIPADPAEVPEQFRWIALVILAVGVLILFIFVLRRLQSAQAEEPEETHESIYSGDLLQDQLSSLWDRWRNRFARGGPHGPAFADLTGEIDTRRRIRAIYQQVLQRAAAEGTPRSPAQTPLEYRPDLERLLHDAPGLSTITAGYLEARYAADPPDVETAQRVAEAWAEMEEDDKDDRSA